MKKCNKTSAFPILKQYYTKFSYIFIIYSIEKSLNVTTLYVTAYGKMALVIQKSVFTFSFVFCGEKSGESNKRNSRSLRCC